MKIRHIGLLFLIALFFIACGGKDIEKPEDVGIKLNVTITPDTITDFLYVDMKYDFQVLDSFEKLDKDMMVFVHFWRMKSKEMLIQDDHMPEKGTSAWQKGDHIAYSRTFFIPKFLDELDIDFEGYEEIKLQVGLYDPKDQANTIVLFSKVLNIQPASINAPDIIYSEGWNEEEMNLALPDPFERVWRWTVKKAECIIENPQKESDLIIKGGLHKEIFEDQKIVFKINDVVLDEFTSDRISFEKRYRLSPEQMGDQPEFKLTIETDKTFIPSSIDPKNKDNRELGVQIFLLYFR